jgi:hypothetical protein
MNIIIEQIRDGLYTFNLELDYSYDRVVSEFENESWELHKDRKDTSGLAGDPYQERSGLMNPKGAILQSIRDYVSSNQVKQQVIEHLYQHQGKYVSSMWEGWSAEQMYNNTFWGSIYNRDYPGFAISNHLDTRLQVATALIYFTEKDDADQSTTYYTSENKDNKIRIENGFGKGVLHLNDHASWHEGANNSNKIRYSLICGLLIKVQ